MERYTPGRWDEKKRGKGEREGGREREKFGSTGSPGVRLFFFHRRSVGARFSRSLTRSLAHCRPLPKNGPHGVERGPLCTRGERAFLRGMPTLAEGGRRRHVDESRAAGKPRGATSLLAGTGERFRERGTNEPERTIPTRKSNSDRTARCVRAVSTVPIYFRFQPTRVPACLRVSHRCSGLNILAPPPPIPAATL